MGDAGATLLCARRRLPPASGIRYAGATMDTAQTAVTLAIGALGVGVAAAADALGMPTIASSLLGLGVVLALLWVRRRLRDRP